MKKRLNGIIVLKLLAAFQVLYLHLVVHYKLEQLEINGITVINKILSPFQGVPIFFALSGYFIWISLSKQKTSLVKYVYRRFIRIYPELWISVFFSVFVILLLYRKNISVTYFITWIFTQSTFLQFWTPSCLRGYGVGCPNGALWTVTVFVQFYILIYILHYVLHNRRKYIWGIVLVVSFLLNIVPGMMENLIPNIVFKLYQQTVFPYLSIFLFAAFVAEYESKLKRLLHSKWICLLLYIILAIGVPVDFVGAGYAIVRSVFVTIFAITFGNTVRCRKLKKDISYEIYLVHMPIVNIFVELTEKQDWMIFLITIVLTVAVAFFLYCLNEKVIYKFEKQLKIS